MPGGPGQTLRLPFLLESPREGKCGPNPAGRAWGWKLEGKWARHIYNEPGIPREAGSQMGSEEVVSGGRWWALSPESCREGKLRRGRVRAGEGQGVLWCFRFHPPLGVVTQV